MGVPTWNYRRSGRNGSAACEWRAKCLLNIAGAAGATIDGLAFDGAGLGKGVHGIFLDKPDYGKHEDAFRIERCQVARFTGDGVNLAHAWCFSVRHSMLAYNHGDGLRLRGWDGFLSDNWFSGNQGAGFGARDENASVTFTANRVEWNGQENILITGGDGYQITGNFFDRAGTCGIALRNGRRRLLPDDHHRQLLQAQRQAGRRGEPRFMPHLYRGSGGRDLRGQQSPRGARRRRHGSVEPRLRHRVQEPSELRHHQQRAARSAPCGNSLWTRAATAKAWC